MRMCTNSSSYTKSHRLSPTPEVDNELLVEDSEPVLEHVLLVLIQYPGQMESEKVGTLPSHVQIA